MTLIPIVHLLELNVALNTQIVFQASYVVTKLDILTTAILNPKIDKKQIQFDITKLWSNLNSPQYHLNFGIQDATKRFFSYMLALICCVMCCETFL